MKPDEGDPAVVEVCVGLPVPTRQAAVWAGVAVKGSRVNSAGVEDKTEDQAEDMVAEAAPATATVSAVAADPGDPGILRQGKRLSAFS